MPYERGPMPELTPEEWERLKQAQDKRADERQQENAHWHVCNDPDCIDTGPHGGRHYHRQND